MTSRSEKIIAPSDPEREVLPPDLKDHFIEARRKAYAGGGEYIMDNELLGFRVFRRDDPQRSYFYEDRYATGPGNFSGFELVRRARESSKAAEYNYAGGLTEQGKKIGEEAVYDKLKKFLLEHAEEVRFGKQVEFSFQDESGEWIYVGNGEVKDWGWEDKEIIIYNGAVVYELNGSGICFIKRAQAIL